MNNHKDTPISSINVLYIKGIKFKVEESILFFLLLFVTVNLPITMYYNEKITTSIIYISRGTLIQWFIEWQIKITY